MTQKTSSDIKKTHTHTQITQPTLEQYHKSPNKKSPKTSPQEITTDQFWKNPSLWIMIIIAVSPQNNPLVLSSQSSSSDGSHFLS